MWRNIAVIVKYIFTYKNTSKMKYHYCVCLDIKVFFPSTLQLKHFPTFNSFWSRRINDCWGINKRWFTFLLQKKIKNYITRLMQEIRTFISLHKYCKSKECFSTLCLITKISSKTYKRQNNLIHFVILSVF